MWAEKRSPYARELARPQSDRAIVRWVRVWICVCCVDWIVSCEWCVGIIRHYTQTWKHCSALLLLRPTHNTQRQRDDHAQAIKVSTIARSHALLGRRTFLGVAVVCSTHMFRERCSMLQSIVVVVGKLPRCVPRSIDASTHMNWTSHHNTQAVPFPTRLSGSLNSFIYHVMSPNLVEFWWWKERQLEDNLPSHLYTLYINLSPCEFVT